MYFNKTVSPFLTGKKFSNGLKINVGNAEDKIISRLDFLTTVTKGKKVIHLGFTDHIPLIQGKIKSNIWLHKLLCETSETCIGVDISEDAVNYVKTDLGFNEVFCHDITSSVLLDKIIDKRWDYLIIGEVLEHIDNPVLFLQKIKENYGNVIDKIIITVPNAFDLTNIRLLRKNTEFINTDHRYWFTPFTLAKVCTRAGYLVESFSFCNSYLPVSKIQKYLLKKYPIVREGIIMTVS